MTLQVNAETDDSEASSQRERRHRVEVALGRIADAVRRGDARRVAVLVRESWFDLLAERPDELRVLLEELPPTLLRERPTLLLTMGILLYGIPHRRPGALRFFVAAVAAERRAGRDLDAVDRALVLVGVSVGHRLVGNPAVGVDFARAAVAALDEMDESDRRFVPHLSRLYSQAGVTLYIGGAVDEAVDAFRRGLAETEDASSPPAFANVAMLAGIHALRGDLAAAGPYLELARSDVWTDRHRSLYTGTFYRIAEAIASLEEFDHAGAQAHLDAMAHDPMTIEHWLTIALTQALVGLVAGQPGAALARLDATVAARDDARRLIARRRSAPTRVLLNLAMGRIDTAAAIAARDSPPGTERHVSLARVQLAFGRPGAALRELQATNDYGMTFRTRAEAGVVEAAALLRLASSARAPVVLEHLGSLLEQTGQGLALGLLPAEDVLRVRRALADAGFGGLVESLPARSLYLDPIDLPEALSERELVVLQHLMLTGSVSRIAAELVVSTNTVKTQLRSLYRKLGASNRDEAIAAALDRRLVADDDAR